MAVLAVLSVAHGVDVFGATFGALCGVVFDVWIPLPKHVTGALADFALGTIGAMVRFVLLAVIVMPFRFAVVAFMSA